jgi:hypothetical protein
MVRRQWQSLNGLWQFNSATASEAPPIGKALPGTILVPFPVESALSGVMKHYDHFWYRRTFEVPARWRGKRLLLHFGAVDYDSSVWVNGQKVGTHRGGYDPFTLEITSSLASEGPQELIVGCTDTTDRGTQTTGKQTRHPEGIWYTDTSGIWQSVWMEPVPESYLESLVTVPQVDSRSVTVRGITSGLPEGLTLEATALDGEKVVGTAQGAPGDALAVPVPSPRLWSPEDPYLYGLRVTLRRGSSVVDRVDSYFGMRKVEVASDGKVQRLMLNGKPVFMVGPLDQGFWPDGLYTAPTDEALRWDLEATRKLGFNMTRKHVKVEPDRWYYWADKLGLLVWQDMPSCDNETPDARKQYEAELHRLVETHWNHPSIIMWVVFNEGWGQYDTERVTRMTKGWDPTRIVNNASGWTDRGVGDVIDMHNYPGPGSPKPEAARAAVLGEFGGLGLPVKGHTWTTQSWGYQGMADQNQLTQRYETLLARAWQLKNDPGLCAAVYTQLTDVETECNGLYTYDREILKVDAKRAAAANLGRAKLPPPPVAVVPTSAVTPATWRFTTDQPAQGWNQPGFDDSAWRSGPGGFGTTMTPGSSVGTQWRTSDIWLRREVELKSVPKSLSLSIHHDEDVQVYLNGVEALSEDGYLSAYEERPIKPEALAALKPGKNVIAVHCHQTTGGQYVDLGLLAPRG